ncbi:MAG: sigma 54-interacting transcriptional regulator [Firmicutes bacterium]|nr:sigma 54-interacting transcriptional regulator [Bacillota bacterium]
MKFNDEKFKWLIENFNYIDSVTMIDDKGRVIVKQRFNPRYTDEENRLHNEWSLNKKLLEAFPSLDYDNSSLLRALNTGELVYYENQTTETNLGRKSVTNNITFPVISRGKIVGAVELSRDVTHIEKGIKSPGVRMHTKAKTQNQAKFVLDDIVTQDKTMIEIKKTIEKIADSKSTVFVYGETGTGKELIVSSIHNASVRSNKPFIPINCAALPESILEGLLFGSQKGAFTGAENKKGLFEEANGGTIYLDEINSMPLILQAKLLRVLQDKEVIPLGATKPVSLDVRIIASTNQPISELINTGKMRTDILYRLNTISIDIPPLRKRKGDIKLLSEYFINKYNELMGKSVNGISEDALELFYSRSWLGNVRELEHSIESAMNVAQSGEAINLWHLPDYLNTREEISKDVKEQIYETMSISLAEAMASYEKKMIIDALKSSNWKIVDAAKKLKIPRTSLQYKMEKYGIKRR